MDKSAKENGNNYMQTEHSSPAINPLPHENCLEVKYSLLTSDTTLLSSQIIGELLKQGVKIFAFCGKELKKILEDGRKAFTDAKLLQVFAYEDGLPTVTIIDGNLSESAEELKAISEAVHEFNYEQYIIEHAPADRGLIVEAGAGTGKTSVMIDRIMFLLNTVPDISFEDIVMVTFTNEATQNMKRRISNAFMSRYNALKSAKYIYYLENAANIRISTIHSFSKDIITEIGTGAGYGDQIKLRSFRYEKKELIREVLNDRFIRRKKERVDKSVGATLNELESLILDFWIKLDNAGLSDEEIESLDWGGCLDEESRALHETLTSVFGELNRRYNALKLEENAISVEDIIIELRRLIEMDGGTMPKRRPFRFLFVDEFQDTDNAQIAAISWLAGIYNLNVFAVGDVKQSIYRFRGAVETAFDKLRHAMKTDTGKELDTYRLIRNYRTSPDVMQETDRIFRNIEKKKLLEYGASLVPQKKIPGCFNKTDIIDGKYVNNEMGQIIRECLRECTETAEKNGTENLETQHVTLLARTNYQIGNAGEFCRSHKIPCYIRKEGTLFLSRAAIDLCAVLRAYAFPDSAEALFNFLDSPYASGTFDVKRIKKHAPGSEEQLEYFRHQLEAVGFSRRLKEFRIRPCLAVIRDLTEDQEVLKRYAAERDDELSQWREADRSVQVNVDCAQYAANLDKILIILRTKFTGEMVSLCGIYDFLKNSILTNRTDDEPDISGTCGPGCLYGMTVHKAKGLEFDTVIIPYTDKIFRRHADTEILLDETRTPHRVGWCKVVWDDKYKNSIWEKKCSSYYADCAKDEMMYTDREEARLLYVAMTRAIRRLEIITPVNARAHTWAKMLEVDDVG